MLTLDLPNDRLACFATGVGDGDGGEVDVLG